MTTEDFLTDCCIMQPTFLPWAGWFDIVSQCGLLVVLDDVAFARRSWQQRNRIRTVRGLEYVTVPVKSSGLYGQLIMDTEVSDSSFSDRIEGQVRHAYRSAPYFDDFFTSFVFELRRGAESGRLVDINVRMIQWLLEALGLHRPMQSASSLGAPGKRGTHLAEICSAIGAKSYLSPAGASDYLSEDRRAFSERDIDILVHRYVHPEYTQQWQPFLPYASAIDILMNNGPSSMEIIRSGRRSSESL